MANLWTRILDKLMPWRTMPSAHCVECGRYRLKSSMHRVGVFHLACGETCADAYRKGVAW